MPQLVEDVSGLMFTMCLCNRWSETNGFLRRLTGTTFAIDGSLMHVILSSKRGELVMSGKQLLFKSAAREKLLRGASVLADAVRVTLGPRSKCVLIQKKFGRPLVCKGSYGFDAATGNTPTCWRPGLSIRRRSSVWLLRTQSPLPACCC